MDALLLTVPEAAAQLGISRAKLYDLITAGNPPSVKGLPERMAGVPQGEPDR